MNNILYKSKNVKQSDITAFETEAKKLLNKLSHIDRIFYNDYFAKEGKEAKYIDNILSINGLK